LNQSDNSSTDSALQELRIRLLATRVGSPEWQQLSLDLLSLKSTLVGFGAPRTREETVQRSFSRLD
jgi:hypothetical protein